MKALHSDALIGLAMLIFSIIFLILSAQMPSDPAVFPKLILTILIIFSLFITWSGVSKTWAAEKQGVKHTSIFQHIRGPLITFIALSLYIVLISILGFFTASSIVTIFFMIYFGVRSYVQVMLVLLIMNTFIYLLFVWQLRIALPTGLLL
ncbi:tripartite tricarboxylate transporter TctB family protein [Halomonas sp. MC140]|nr:tripartite tricarboxylate transporter TctB family protein [Halomonas sp. MC140]MDN7133519.1 tripartite tricarboxylate transporter TctB family protein [Halomonas sp. MC140]